MSDSIKAIAAELCDLAGDCGRCNMDGCGPLLVARAIYTAHVKPLEEELAKAEAVKAELVDALESCCSVLEEQHTDRQYMALVKARATLARVKEEA